MEKDVMHASVLTCYCPSFVDKAVILFNAHVFVIPTCEIPIDDSQSCAHIFEDALEPTVVVEDDNRNHAEQENDILYKYFCEMLFMCLRSNSRYNTLR